VSNFTSITTLIITLVVIIEYLVKFGNSLYVARLDDARFWVPNKSGMVWIESVRTYWAAIYHIIDRRACSHFLYDHTVALLWSTQLGYSMFSILMITNDLLEVIQCHSNRKYLFVWLFVQLNSVLLRIARMRFSLVSVFIRTITSWW